MRVAGIDCGTNSIRLLVADVHDGRLVDVVREMRIVRLGQGVDRTGRLAPEALERTRVALREYAGMIRELAAVQVRMVATSATRDAANRDEFVAMVQAEFGVEPEVISGHEEAELSFAGAASVLPELRGPMLVADIGGGSTELVRGDRNMLGSPGPLGGGRLQAHSMNVGCVRMTERHLRDDPPTTAQVEATVADLRAAIDAARKDVPLDADAAFIGVAGTVTTIAAIVLDLDEYDPVAIHGARISAAQVAEVTARLLDMRHAERAALPVMHPGRVDVIGGGALVLRTLVEEIGADSVIASEHDILDGIALSLG
jgi:exopolyphosphatase/guanosine-5'-triphosphate,3'-diphosphate pyrophosphatase